MVKKLKDCEKSEKLQKPKKVRQTIGLEEPNCLTSSIRLAFTKMGSSRTYNGGLLAIVEIFFTNYIFKSSEIQRTRASNSFTGLESCLNTTFTSIIDKAKLIVLLKLE